MTLVCLSACDGLAIFAPLMLPDSYSRVSGGIADGRPFFGKTYDALNLERGDFLLATCGCGDWRVLIRDDDGRQKQFAVSFYDTGEYDPAGEVVLFGREEELAALGAVQQSDGTATGSLDLSIFRRSFSAERRETHTNDIEACILCHIGEDPIYPQPEGHPVYQPGVTNCLNCHEVNIN